MKKFNAIVFLTFVLCAPMVHAQTGEMSPQDGGDRMEGRVQKIFDELNLSQQQREMLEANRAKHKESKKAAWQAMKDNMTATGEALKQQDLDMRKLKSLHEEQKRIANQMSDERFNSILEVRKILTKEQFAKFMDTIKDHLGKRGR